MPKVKVLLSTYNGETYLKELLDSLIAQTDVVVSLLVRDDGSTDSTLNILRDYANKMDLHVIAGDNIGWRNSFMTLLSLAETTDESEYFAFADQDDVYDRDKFSAAIEKLEPLSEQPALYHGNVTLTDGKGKILGTRYPTQFVPTNQLPEAYFNVVWLGTTMVFNRAMMTLVKKHVPIDNIVHDAYVINLAQFLGQVIYDPTPHVRYRRHSETVTGFGRSDSSQKIKAPSLLDRYRRYKQNPFIFPFSKRAHEILSGYDAMLTAEQRSFLQYLDTYRSKISSRLYLLLSPKIRASSIRVTLQVKYRILAKTL